jgi:hypothetical protein
MSDIIQVYGRGAPVRGQIGPYPFGEAIGVVWRNIVGPSRNNPANVQFIPKSITLNDIEPELTLGVGGDVMMMFGRKLQFGDCIKDFFAPCDAILLNMEGVITDHPKKGPDQKHDPCIIDDLARLFDPKQTYLSLANNHSGDFGMDECYRSQRMFEQAGFHSFGLRQTPYIDIHPALRVVTGTQWSNRPCHDLVWLDESPEQYRRHDAFNLLFPHWAYEMECYPRQTSVAQMQQWLRQFDGVIGHHAHVPQPITSYQTQDQRQQLAAYSLGDLCFGLGFKNRPILKHYPYGIVARLQIGRLRSNPALWSVGRCDWSFTESDSSADRLIFSTKLASSVDYFKFT